MSLSGATITAKASAIASATKELRSVGEKILSKLTGCHIKPKGTPHAEVHQKLPKFFHIYGTGVPGSKEFRPEQSTNGAVFDIQTGYWFITPNEIDAIFSAADRRMLEATARKECESVTGDYSYYIAVHSPSSAKGFVRLRDGLLYDAAVYGVQGGSATNPLQLDVERKKIPGEISNTSGKTSTQERQEVGAGFNPIALGLLLLPAILKK
jgi:hypothetical protein